MADVSGLNSLEALAYLYADMANNGEGISFDTYIDNRYEDTFDIISRGVLKNYQKNLLGNNDAVDGIVLRVTPHELTPSPGTPTGPTQEQDILRNLGMVTTLNLMSAHVMVLKTKHTKVLPIPGSYDGTLDDELIIDNYPQFIYSPEHFPLVPGSFVKGQFDQNTFRGGVITELQPKSPYILIPVSTVEKADLINDSAPTLGDLASFDDIEQNPVSEVSQEYPPWIFPFNPAANGWNGYMIVSSPYAYRSISVHDGVHRAFDIGCRTGTPYVAVAEGVVRRERYHEGAGNYIDIKYKDPREGYGGFVYLRYLHMRDRAIVKKGETVSAGQLVGYAGSTGRSTGPHLHMDVRRTTIYKPPDPKKGEEPDETTRISPARFWPASYYRHRLGSPGNYTVGPPIASVPASIPDPLLGDQ